MTNIRHIVYDIGKVLIRYDPERAYLDLITDAETRAWFLDNVCTNGWNLEQDRGRSWVDAEAELIEQHPRWEAEIRAFRNNWHLMVHDRIAESVALFEALIDAGHDVTLLTNFASDTFRQAQDIFPFLKRGRGVTVSGDVRLIKPDRAIYDLHAKTFDLHPAATIFIDDSLPNVHAAHAAGWHSEQFTDTQTWRGALARHGIELT
ncbi:MAG: HAD family phosphatase [Pseudomonadota bacterium]